MLLLLITVCVAAIVLGQSANAQIASGRSPTLSGTAAIVVDGRSLFRISSIKGFSAHSRANYANAVLRAALVTTPPSQPIAVSLLTQDGLTTLQVNTRHLLTLTESDRALQLNPRQTASEWATLLRSSLRIAQVERSPTYRLRALLHSLGALSLASGLHFAIRRWRRGLHRQFAGLPLTTKFSSLGLVQRWLNPCLYCLQGLAWIMAIAYCTEQFPELRQGRYQIARFLGNSFQEPIVITGDSGLSLLDIVRLVALAIGLWLVVRTMTLLIKSRLLSTTGIDRGTQDAIATLVQVVLSGLGFVILLQALGIDLGVIAIVASVLGVGIGFGLQNIANNFISGLIILFERPIQVGDFVNLGDLAGTVEHIGARSTEIRTLDLVTIIVPNSDFIQNKVINWSHGHPVSRLHIPFGVAYGSAVRRVLSAALEAAKTHPEILRHPQPQLWFQGFGDSSLNFDLLVWIREPRHQFKIKSDLYYLLEASLRRYGIQIPFPQRDIHLRSPQLEQWFDTYASSRVNGAVPVVPADAPAPDPLNPADPLPEGNGIPEDVLADLRECAVLLHPHDLSDSDLKTLSAQIRGANGVEIKDRRYGLKIYPRCFVGSEAVEWLMKTQKATREEALRIGQLLVERGCFHHVTDEHTLEDAYLFYRFYEDE